MMHDNILIAPCVCVVVCCSVLQCVAVSRVGGVAHNARQHLDGTLRALQCVAVCCSVL